MDPRLRNLANSRTQLGNPPNTSFLPNQRFENSFLDHSFPQLPYYFPSHSNPFNVVQSSNGISHEDESPEDCDFSDTVLRYINQILMEEDREDNTCTFQDSLDLQAAERSFYEVLGKNYPPSPDPNLVSLIQNEKHQPYESITSDSTNYNYSSTGYFNGNTISSNSFSPQNLSTSGTSQVSYSSSNSVINSIDGLIDSPSGTFPLENQSISQFIKGVEEANKFLPSGANFFNTTFHEPNAKISELKMEEERKNYRENLISGQQRGRKTPHRDNGDIEEGRCSKQPSVYVETEMEPQVFDRMVLYTDGEGWKDFNDLCDKLKNTSIKDVSKVQVKGDKNAKGRRKKNNRKKEMVDLRTLLISCAQAVAADDHRRAYDFLKQVKQHSSPFGDGNQRLAHCFANGLEARLAGTGSQIYRGLVSKRTAAANLLKAYHLYLAASPFRKLSNFVSNLTIMNHSANSTRLHIIDFGIFYGFQWPTLIQRLSWRHGGSPTIRMTGIDFPQPGFRPAERVDETGRRLATYAKKFGVPFVYKGIAKKWETIKLEELEIDNEEVVIVTCLYWAKNLLDETVTLNSPKDILLELVKKIKPNVFIHGINNGAYNAPFFVTRFREALFHFSSLFDMLDTVVPRDNVERMLIEKELLGREALNVVACEGSERIERPETYKQWQVRSLRAGFVQLPFDGDIIKQAFEKVRKLYQKDFLIDQDGQWLLQGWKGRILFTLSAWRPT
ncbi:scarecrow-like protein 9 [Euphorbia lathyris]|uniref:scarecrow-like protein 9 n=1 Tax=Euphorbia lathyris TaxID=212925 RepID=UPI003313F2E8